ncbi:hypothetical protein A3H26_04110 [candidate division WWE3 bacterium RIFCSPLOWO2_12_FULL_36_10]|uniref:AbiEi antitoxin N-terminal domain-containing protein n=1 Tax=candidate division WWE3 bacterium RIFCSPLOWO2_12_FULL_36_10 TaxID=1802630 RepID=A0A1F4VJD2_UNCKA|nr:MAG: hypothetical protein A3H26_04110 [candidate division WWE3 bacterium RIFCSPLOWO2_12_FULL_36_10]
MQKGDYLTTLLRSTKSVLTLKDIALLWQDSDTNAARVRLNYYVKKGDLYRLRRGLYSKDKNYSKLELGARIFTPSYISFETVLAKEGLIFQYQTAVTLASYLTRQVTVADQVFNYQSLKKEVLINNKGILTENEISIASKERAFIDTLYVHNGYHFDNLRSLNWDLVFEMLPLYENDRVVKTVNKLFLESKEGIY